MKKILLASALATALAFSAPATDHGYTNPVIPGFHPDPSVVRVGEDYYLVNSSFQFFPGVPIFHSRDLVHWQQIGNVLDRPEQLPLTNASAWLGIYAPTIRYHDGLYYMVTTNVGNGAKGGGNFFVTAKDPAGPWSNPVWLDQGGIDPSLFWEDGKCYLVSNPDVMIKLCEIDTTTGEQLTPSVDLWQGTGGRHPEAPHIFKKDGWYYLLIAEGGTEMGHSVTIARSRDIRGPYESNPDNPILTHLRRAAQNNKIQGTGHADLVQAHDGSWWMVCLAFRTQANNQHLTGRETYLAPVTWNEDGWPVVNGGNPIELQMNVPTLPQHPVATAPETYDFTTLSTFPHEWVFLRNPHTENYAFTPEGLLLKGTDVTLQSLDSPTFVALRQLNPDFTASETFSVANLQSGARAGLTVYMDTHSHYDAYVTRTDPGTYRICLSYNLHALHKVEQSVAIPANAEITIKVVGSDDMYDFYYSLNDGDEHKLGSLNARFLSTETAGGFTGITLGMFAEGAADVMVKNFSYK